MRSATCWACGPKRRWPRDVQCLSTSSVMPRESGASSTHGHLSGATGSPAFAGDDGAWVESKSYVRSMNSSAKISSIEQHLRALARERILVLDGAMGTMSQSL